MAASVKHSKVSAVPDGGDTTLVRPSDWNADHVLAGVQGTITLTTTGTGAATFIADTLNIPTPPADTGITQLTGDVTAGPGSGSQAASVVKINGVSLAGLATGILKNTTGTGAPSIAVAGTDYQAPSANLTSWAAITRAAGFDSFTATPSSANLRALLTDETGTGLAYFQGGALGTPSSGTATNLTGTAAGLTAGNVTTNANLTGVITSVGNATSIASQTGTGTKFVVDTSPVLVTPTIGAAAGTSLSLSGLTASSAVATDGSKNLVSVTNTGSGNNVLATSPTLVTPALGTPSALVLTNATLLPLTSGVTGTLPIANGGTNGTTVRDAALGLNGGYVLAQSASPSSVTGTTSETILVTVAIPANTIGANGHIEITSSWTVTNSANNKQERIRFGASGAGTGGTVYASVPMTTSATLRNIAGLANRNATNSQVGLMTASSGGNGGGFGTSTGALTTSAVDTTAAAEIVFTGTLANSGETITLEDYVVVVYPKS